MGFKLISSLVSVPRSYRTLATTWDQKGLGDLKNKKKNSEEMRRERIEWTDEQKFILQRAKCGDSIFVTGSAGTGKTVLLREIIKSQKKLGRVFVTASTGVAACALNGQTLHSFAGVGIGTAHRKSLWEHVDRDTKAVKRWIRADTLVIDEISMVNAVLFDDLDYIARCIRECDEPWGGLQLIVCGDFLQLPPVIDYRRKSLSCKEFAFEADCWDSCFDMQVELTKVFRQSDSRLIKLLQGIRRGETDAEDMKYLEQSCSATEPDPSVIRLFPRINDVQKVNNERMQALHNKIVVYEAEDYGKYSWKSRLKYCSAPERVELCEGARVMLIKNLNSSKRLVNGATGVVAGFFESGNNTRCSVDGLLPIVKFDSGVEMVVDAETWELMEKDKVVAWRWQIPLILAWALSIHKCQGVTLDKLHTDLSKAFGCGMVYVALSRLRNLEGLHLSGFSPEKIKAHPKVLDFYRRFHGDKDEEGKDEEATKNEDEGSGLPKNSDRTCISGSAYIFSLKESVLAWQRSQSTLLHDNIIQSD